MKAIRKGRLSDLGKKHFSDIASAAVFIGRHHAWSSSCLITNLITSSTMAEKALSTATMRQTSVSDNDSGSNPLPLDDMHLYLSGPDEEIWQNEPAGGQIGYNLALWIFECYANQEIGPLSGWRDTTFLTKMTPRNWCKLQESLENSGKADQYDSLFPSHIKL